MSINDKIKQVLTSKQLSPSQLADDIGVQRSSISHILSGRNRPSLDIIQKIVRCYSEFTYDWFLEEDNSQLSIDTQPRIASSPPHREAPSAFTPQTRSSQSHRIPEPISQELENRTNIPKHFDATQPEKVVERILIFYSDGTFREYKPA